MSAVARSGFNQIVFKSDVGPSICYKRKMACAKLWEIVCAGSCSSYKGNVMQYLFLKDVCAWSYRMGTCHMHKSLI